MILPLAEPETLARIIENQERHIIKLGGKIRRQREALRKFNKMVQCFNAGFSYGAVIARKNMECAQKQKGQA